MKIALTFASVLSWVNIIIWGLIVVFGLFFTVPTGQLLPMLVVVLLSSIPLNCYAALKLQTSIRHPNVPLGHETPVGIRFVGLIALFFGILYVGYGAMIAGHPNMLLDSAKVIPDKLPGYTPEQLAALGKLAVVVGGVIAAVLGLLVAVNVILNFRLLRWYYLVHRSDVP
jgi:hypothetical protein